MTNETRTVGDDVMDEYLDGIAKGTERIRSMTNETRTPHKCPSCKASFTDDGEFAEHMGGRCTPSPADDGWQGKVAGSIPPLGPPTLCGPLTDKDFRPVDHDGIMQPVDPADFDRARELVERLRRTKNCSRSFVTNRTAPPITSKYVVAINPDGPEAADLIEQLLAERADAVQAGEKIGRAKGLAYARKVFQRYVKHGARL